MKKLITYGITLSLLLTFSSFQKKNPAKANLKDRLIALAEKKHIPTLSVFIKSPRGNVEFTYKNKDKAIDPVRVYGLASTTKFLSALLVLKNVEEGKIHLEDPIVKYVDSTSLQQISWFKKITVRHLLNHTSGIADYTKHPEWMKGLMAGHAPKTDAEKLALVTTTDTTLHLGKHAYSNTNYVLLEMIIAKVCNKDAQQVFNEFYTAQGFPGISFTDAFRKQQAFFSQAENSNGNVSDWQENYGFDGGAYCSAQDLSGLLTKVFVEKEILNASSIEQMKIWTDVGHYRINYGFAQMTAYGLGLMKYEWKDRVFIGHAGSSLKYQCFAFIEPSSGTEIILQTNGSGRYYNNAFFIDLMEEIVGSI